MVLSADEVRLGLDDFDLQQLALQIVVLLIQLALQLLQLVLFLAHADVGFLQGGACAVDLGQCVLDRAHGRDGCHIERDAHELRVRLVEIAGRLRHSRSLFIDVLQHRLILRLGCRQVNRKFGNDERVALGFLGHVLTPI